MKYWGHSSNNIGRSVSIAVGYCQVTTGNELLARVAALLSVAFRGSTCSKRQIMETENEKSKIKNEKRKTKIEKRKMENKK